MKTTLPLVFALFIGLIGFGQDSTRNGSTDSSVKSSFDPKAIAVLDRMSEVIGELNSCSFQLKTAEDIPHDKAGYIRQYSNHDVYLVGPDKMHIYSKRPKENNAYWYNGDIMMYYSFTYNHYGFIETPDNIRETIDMVHYEYGVDFPAADFLYPTFTDDLMESSDYIEYIGLAEVDGVECHYIVSKGPTLQVHLWISNDGYELPMRYTINEIKNGEKMQFEGIFSNWYINPDLSDALFDFVVPESARRLNIVSKSSTK